jgi:Cellulose synthase subunit D
MNMIPSPIPSLLDNDAQTFYLQRRCSPQWRAFLTSFSHELFRNAQKDEACAFLREIGRGMAEIMQLPQAGGLAELQGLMNAALDQADWGLVSLSDGGHAITIMHVAAPAVLPEDLHGAWTRSLGHVLEGLYSQWFYAQGSAPHLRTTLVSASGTGEFQFRHGR